MLKIGDTAPSFTLFSSEKNEVSLSDFQGQSVVILFFPLAFTGVCTTELCNTRDDIQSYKNLNAQVAEIQYQSRNWTQNSVNLRVAGVGGKENSNC